MIKFFRNIRQQSIKENRFTRYLLYAIGEIILVVIGILIAINVNNWNKQRKDQEELDRLVFNLKQNLVKQEELLKNYTNSFYQKDSLLDVLINSNEEAQIFKDPRWLYGIFNSKDDFYASISEIILDENIQLILDRKSEFSDEYSELLLIIKFYETAVELFERSFFQVQNSMDDIRNYLINTNEYYLRLDSIGYAGLRRAYESDPFLKTRLRVYHNNYKNALSNLKSIKSLHTSAIVEIEILNGATNIEEMFRKFSFQPLPKFTCDSLAVDPSLFTNSGEFIINDNYPFYNKTEDTLIVKIVVPGGAAIGGSEIPPRVFRWFDHPPGMAYKIFHKDSCLFQTLAIRNGFLILSKSNEDKFIE